MKLEAVKFEANDGAGDVGSLPHIKVEPMRRGGHPEGWASGSPWAQERVPEGLSPGTTRLPREAAADFLANNRWGNNAPPW